MGKPHSPMSRNAELLTPIVNTLFCKYFKTFITFPLQNKLYFKYFYIFSMGINHDNDHPSCADGLHIMSGEWIKGQNLGDVSWSRCSREDLERFLR